MNILHGFEGLGLFLRVTTIIGGIGYGWIIGLMRLGDYFDGIGAPEWIGSMMSCSMPFSLTLILLLALVFGVCAHN